MNYAITGTIFTLVVFVCFIGIVLWAYSTKAKVGFDEAQNLVFDDEPQPQKRKAEINE
jgi:cytochrome c oxidase cbb3-type subunit 4